MRTTSPKPVMKGLALALAVGAASVTESTQAQNINVNMYASNGGNQNPEDPATLEGPAGGLGETWNQFKATSGSNLLAASGVPTSVGFTNNVGTGWAWGNPDLPILKAGRAHFGKGADTTHTITGLTPGSLYDIWIASYADNGSLVERALGEWSTPNPTTTAGPQMIDSRTTGLIGDSWEYGVNYVLFESVEADGAGEIILFGDAADDGEYGGVSATRLALSGWQVREAVIETVTLSITPNAANTGNYDFSWDSKDDKVYDLVSHTDLSVPRDTWPVWQGNANMAGTAPENTLPNVPGGTDPIRFFAMVEKNPPPLLSESFDAGPGVPAGWTAADNTAGTSWEVGDPSSGPDGGPGAAASGANCAGTNIAANYTGSADATLTSPAMAVPAGGATLSFQQYIDTDGSGDVGAVRLLDADNADIEIIDGNFPVTPIEGIEDGWTARSFTLPPAALGKNVKVRFQFVSDSDTEVYTGFYIDDVVLTAGTP